MSKFREYLDNQYDEHHITIGWTDGENTMYKISGADADEDVQWIVELISGLNNDFPVVPTDRDPAYDQNVIVIRDLHGHHDGEAAA
jgi:hypothetical protein